MFWKSNMHEMYDSFTIHWHFQCTIDTKTACIRKKNNPKSTIYAYCHTSRQHMTVHRKNEGRKKTYWLYTGSSYIEAYPNSIKHVLLREKKQKQKKNSTNHRDFKWNQNKVKVHFVYDILQYVFVPKVFSGSISSIPNWLHSKLKFTCSLYVHNVSS